jgi:excisionase family DNA binding protein
MSNYVSVSEAAEELGVSARQVRHMCANGELGEKMGKHWVITRDELEKIKRTPQRGPGRPERILE